MAQQMNCAVLFAENRRLRSRLWLAPDTRQLIFVMNVSTIPRRRARIRELSIACQCLSGCGTKRAVSRRPFIICRNNSEQVRQADQGAHSYRPKELERSGQPRQRVLTQALCY